jgi:hypothetical protein
MCPDQRIVVSGKLPMYRIQHQTVCHCVILLLFGEAYSTQHSQSIRIERHHGVRASEQKYLFRPRIADAWKSLQGFLRLRQRLLENRTQVAVELLIGNLGNGEKFFRTHVGEYASFANSCQRGMLSGKNLFGAYPDGSFENGERFKTALVTRQIRDVLPDD